MRLVGDVTNEKQAAEFSLFLQREKIQCVVEPFSDPATQSHVFHVWVVEEDDYDVALKWYERYVHNPHDPVFGKLILPSAEEETLEDFQTEEKGTKLRLAIRRKKNPFAYLVTYLLFFICICLFVVNVIERDRMEQRDGHAAAGLLLTPIQQNLMFDYPSSLHKFQKLLEEALSSAPDNRLSSQQVEMLYETAQKHPSWQGVYSYLESKEQYALGEVPVFEKIRKGQVWRLFSPCLLHSDFLHILFNMAWLWVLGRQIEERVGKKKFLLLVLAAGVASNLAQYVMSGPLFLGFSGIVVGMAGFIFSRQRKAPWEGYPLHRTTLMFILFFVLVMFFLEIVSFSLHFFSLYDLSPSIANTAHVAGGLAGLALGRLRYFARRSTT